MQAAAEDTIQPEFDSRPDACLTGRLFPHGSPVTVQVEGGRITAVNQRPNVDSSHATERWIVPGFFDLQVNGFAGRSFIDAAITRQDVEYVARALLRTGVTRFLPTIITADLDHMCDQLAVIAGAIQDIPLIGAMCPGIHVEGPFIHPEDGPRGAHPREHVRRPNSADFDRLFNASAGRIALLTLAPDQPGAIELIRHVVQSGVLVSLGHHRADQAAIAAAIDAGARLCTHLGNGIDAELDVQDNPVWRQLGEDRLWASFIADGHHLPPAALKCSLRAKTTQRSVLITDAVAAAGMPPGRFRFAGKEAELLASGRTVLPGTPFLAGSAASMTVVLSQAVVSGDVSFTNAVAMATMQPRQLMADHTHAWSCTIGAPADLVELDWHPADGRIVIRQVILGDLTVHSDQVRGTR